jgi:hypothetical protein
MGDNPSHVQYPVRSGLQPMSVVEWNVEAAFKLERREGRERKDCTI